MNPFAPLSRYVRRKPVYATRTAIQSRARLRLEELENRLAPAVILWDGGPNGTGTLNNSGTFESNNGGTLNIGANNQAVMEFKGNDNQVGSLGNAPGGTVRVKGTSFDGPAFLTADRGFNNQGTIELTSDPGF